MLRFLTMALLISGVYLPGLASFATAQNSPAAPTVNVSSGAVHMRLGAGTVIIPESSQANVSDAGIRAHTNFEVFVPQGLTPDEAPPFPGYAFETPASLACIYRLVTAVSGCNPNTVTANASGGSKAIAIVDAYDDPWAGPDLAYFSDQFGLPFSPSQLTVVYANGTQPSMDNTGEWELEESTDIEYVHAMAPNAHIFLVEAASNSISDLLSAVVVANNEVLCGQANCPSGGSGAGEVSMSWGTDEFPAETSLDSYFRSKGIVYFAATGDTPGTAWPSTSPNVVAAGGTTTARGPSSGNLLYEITWTDAGGGLSPYEGRPAYQNSISYLVGSQRGVPDLSLDSNPDTGVWVWDSNYFDQLGGGWFIVGGTSVATQALAGIVNSAGHFNASSSAELTTIYANRSKGADFRDITTGFCGPYSGDNASAGWDVCTGVGSDIGLTGK
ncbi:MAG TPA: peptidase S8/S53 subtilisin kexin sedolisin [Terriglobia bacterium]|nr:peptidase S8/S53 subtilisin kexin sedolisin [Terriglobia bacterium]